MLGVMSPMLPSAPSASAGASSRVVTLLVLLGLAVVALLVLRTMPEQPGPRASTEVAKPTAGDVFAGTPGELTLVIGHTGGRGNLPGRGTEARTIGAGAIVAGPGGEVYAASSWSAFIQRIAPDGTVSEVFPQGITLPPARGGEDDPRGTLQLTQIALAPDGAFIAVDGYQHVVLRVERDGRARIIAGQWRRAGYRDGPAARSLLNAPMAVAVAGDGSVYVADALNGAIRRIGPDGRVSTFYRGRSGTDRSQRTNPDPQRPGPSDLAFDASGRLWMLARYDVNEGRNHALYRFDSRGRIELTVGRLLEAGSADGPPDQARFDQPRDLSADAEGNVWVGEAGGFYAIRKIAPDGSVSTVARVPCEQYTPCAAITPQYAGYLGIPMLAFEGRTRVLVDSSHGAYYTLADDGSTVPLVGLRPCWPMRDGARSQACLGEITAMVRHADGALTVIDGLSSLRRIEPDGRVHTLQQIGPVVRFDPPQPAVAASNAASGSTAPLTAEPWTLPLPRREGLALAGDDVTLYVGIGQAIARRSADGKLTLASPDPIHGGAAEPAGPGPNHLEDVRAIVRLSDGHLLVAEGLTNVLRRVDPATGTLTIVAGRYGEAGHRDGAAADALFDSLEHLALAPDGTVYVGDRAGIRALRRDGQVVTVYGESSDPASTGGCGARADALAVAADGTLWFATTDPPRVWRLKPGAAPEWIAGDRVYEGVRPGRLPGHLARVRALLPTDDGGVLIASGAALLKALPAPAVPAASASVSTTAAPAQVLGCMRTS